MRHVHVKNEEAGEDEEIEADPEAIDATDYSYPGCAP
jgi:hypothetical protein